MASSSKKKSTRSSKPAPKSSAPAESLVIGSRVKAMVAAAGMRSDAGFVEALSTKVAQKIQRAIERARDHGVSTVRARDL